MDNACSAYHVVYRLDEICVVVLPFGLKLGKLKDWTSLCLLAVVIRKFVHLVIVRSVNAGGLVVIDMFLCSVAFDPVNGSGVVLPVLYYCVVKCPQVSIGVECPWLFGYCIWAG